MPDLSDTDTFPEPSGASRRTAEVSAPSPQSEYDFDLLVIGGGSGGIRAARVASGYGARVMLAEEYRLRGTCVIRGCVPKKLFVYASRFSDTFDEAAEFGWRLSVPHFDWPSLVAAKDREITRLEALYGIGQENAGRRGGKVSRRTRGRAYGALEARAQYPAVDVYKVRFRPLKAAVTGDCETALLKVIVDCTTDRILGIHIFAEEASEMIQVLAIAIGSGATMKDFVSVMAVHPTVGEEIVAMQTPTVRYDRRDASSPLVPSAAV
ncbi:FAD-dependent oxidoreductase [Bradyrhizobium sp. LA7.1]|uniref:FAD-dependent oxidoreductase n=1 Tax=Bradyrhizobium sp. LA7.1 TaxID=3156324 RepID=UPI003395FB47